MAAKEEKEKIYYSRKFPGLAGKVLESLGIAEKTLETVRREKRTELQLVDLGLTSLPEALGQLSQLQLLDLSHNLLTSLPGTLGQLSRLQRLNLYTNQLSSLPAALGQLSQLQLLDASNNELTSLPDTLGNLSQLQYLILDYNLLTSLPPTLGQLSHLRRLKLGANKLVSLPETLWNLTQLQELNLHSNQFATLPEALGRLSQLKELHLTSNLLTTLPAGLGELFQLQLLDLSHNQLTSLPTIMGQLSQLQGLHLSGNRLTSLPETLGQLTQVQELNLSENHLTSLPATLGNLSQLQRLHLHTNLLDSIPETLGQLPLLSYLELTINNLTSLPDTLGQLLHLSDLNLSRNQLTSLPDTLGQLAHLRRLELDNNELTELPETLLALAKAGVLEVLFLHENARLGIPNEVLGATSYEIWNTDSNPAKPLDILNYYFASRGGAGRALRELKVILVGRGEVGKTTLVDALQGKPFVENRPKTEGIAITPWEINLEDGVEGGKATAHVWDFGGQQIMHGTHQFFMTHRAIYLVVLDGRTDLTKQDAEYWLKLVRAFGGEHSPVMLVLNKQGEHPYSIDSEYFVQKYQIDPRHIYPTECADEKHDGVPKLRAAILKEATDLLSKREVFPGAWSEMKKYLASMRERGQDFLSDEQYHHLCEEKEVPADQKESLLRLLSELGIVVSFPDKEALAHLLVLNPEWATDGVYRVLNDRDLVEKRHGQLSLTELKRILPAERWGLAKHRLYLLDLMAEFELCFPMEGKKGTVLVPELLPEKTPALEDWKAEECLVFLYTYPSLPQGVLPRFITRTHELSEGKARWRSGVILEREDAEALVRADYDQNEMSIWVRGKAGALRRQLLTIVREHLDTIHDRIENLGEQALLTVPRHPDTRVSLGDVLDDEAVGKRTMRLTVAGERIEVFIKDLLEGVNTAGDKKKRALKNPNTLLKRSGGLFIEKIVLGDHARLSLDHIEEQIVAQTVQKIEGGTFHGPVGVHQDFKECYNSVQQLPDIKAELKAAMLELLERLSKLHAKLDDTAAVEATTAVKRLAEEVALSTPKVKRVQRYADDLLEAIEAARTNHDGGVEEATRRLLEAAT